MSGIGDYRALHTLRMLDKYPKSDHASHGETGKVGLLHANRIHNADGICDKHIKCIITCRRYRLPVASRTVSQHPITISDGFGEFVPHRHVGRQAMTKHDPGAAIHINPAIERRLVGFNFYKGPDFGAWSKLVRVCDSGEPAGRDAGKPFFAGNFPFSQILRSEAVSARFLAAGAV